jgi:hypothetical protein
MASCDPLSDRLSKERHMKRLTSIFERAVCLFAAIGVATLITFVHGADRTSLGAHSRVVSGRTTLAAMHPARAGIALAAHDPRRLESRRRC